MSEESRLSMRSAVCLGRKVRWQYALVLTGLLLTIAASFPAILGAGLPWVGYWLAQTPRVSQADAIVVLNGNMQRLQQGINLYSQELAPEFWHTGDVPDPEGISFAQFAAGFAVERGVPAGSIRLLATTSTWEDGQQIVALVRERQVKSLLVVTDWYHSRRALCVLERLTVGSEIAIYYAPSVETPYGPENWWRCPDGRTAVFGELVKAGFYWVRYGIAPYRPASGR